MYLSYFGLNQKPFAQVPQTTCLFPATSTIDALENLRFGLLTQHSISLLTSGPGLGKSLILQALAEELNNTHRPIYLPTTGIPGRAAFLQAILFELKRPYAHLGEQELRLSLIGAARELQQTRLGIVLLLDELHLADDEVLMEIRTLTTFAELGRPLFSVIAAGQIELEDRLTHPKHAPFNQRIGSHVLLKALSRQETIAYIRHQIEWAQGQLETIFTTDALELISRVSGGVPRNINLICDQTLMLAFAESESLIDVELVEATLNEMAKFQTNTHWDWSPLEGTNKIQNQDADNSRLTNSMISSSLELTTVSSSEVVCFEVGVDFKQAPSIETLRQPLTSATTATVVHELAHLELAKTKDNTIKINSPKAISRVIEEFTIDDRYTNLDYARQLSLQTTHGISKSIVKSLPTVPQGETRQQLEIVKEVPASIVEEVVDVLESINEVLQPQDQNINEAYSTITFDVVMPEDPAINLTSAPVNEESLNLHLDSENAASVVIDNSAEATNLRLDTPLPVKKSRSFKSLFSKLRSQQ